MGNRWAKSRLDGCGSGDASKQVAHAHIYFGSDFDPIKNQQHGGDGWDGGDHCRCFEVLSF